MARCDSAGRRRNPERPCRALSTGLRQRLARPGWRSCGGRCERGGRISAIASRCHARDLPTAISRRPQRSRTGNRPLSWPAVLGQTEGRGRRRLPRRCHRGGARHGADRRAPDAGLDAGAVRVDERGSPELERSGTHRRQEHGRSAFCEVYGNKPIAGDFTAASPRPRRAGRVRPHLGDAERSGAGRHVAASHVCRSRHGGSGGGRGHLVTFEQRLDACQSRGDTELRRARVHRRGLDGFSSGPAVGHLAT